MREPDKDRVRRAMEHIMAAITNINSIKSEHRNRAENIVLEDVRNDLASEYRLLKKLAEREEGQ